MNYKIPLLNLIVRGHIKTNNQIGTQRFIEQLDNESCGAILESLLFHDNSSDCAHILENIQETFELDNNIRFCHKINTMTRNRDTVLEKSVFCENDSEKYINLNENEAVSSAQQLLQSDYQSLKKLLKLGLFGTVAIKLSLMKPEERAAILQNLKDNELKLYSILVRNPKIAKILPKDQGFFVRYLDSKWSGANKMGADDLHYLNRIKSGIKSGLKTTALIGAGVTTAIIGINLLNKHVFSLEAKLCKGKMGKERTICMCEASIKAAEKAIKKAEEALVNCDSAKNPEECRYKMKVEIRSWMKKIREQNKKLAKLKDVNTTSYAKPKGDTTDVPTTNTPFGNSDPFGAQ